MVSVVYNLLHRSHQHNLKHHHTISFYPSKLHHFGTWIMIIKRYSKLYSKLSFSDCRFTWIYHVHKCPSGNSIHLRLLYNQGSHHKHMLSKCNAHCHIWIDFSNTYRFHMDYRLSLVLVLWLNLLLFDNHLHPNYHRSHWHLVKKII